MFKKHYLIELKVPDNYLRIGQTGNDVKRVQEWINLWKFYAPGWNHQIVIDSDFGPATDYAVKQFQQFRDLQRDGIVGPVTWMELVKPMREAFKSIPFYESCSLRTRVAAFAHQHTQTNPTEINSNMGPWVRAYMDGNDGREWYCCVGFTETILDMAYSSMNKDYRNYFPNPSYFSCDKLLEYARTNNRLVEQTDLVNSNYLPRKGDLFLNMNPNNHNDATHIGIVINCAGTILTTIEGNTDDNAGSRNGGEVCNRTRDFGRHLIYVVKLE